ncbi:substrate-binding domain-containing protein [Ectothiorhodospira lacustris]|uniref:substrate-binding domain-containing protein n=1 Tax=Ectothiorhodospira lacustris TaxID=2899127 RepID=UPI001EE8EFF8|nr:substrate-binding domain-containing protein [Ectothiorhodospira lacustris]MCG5501707.1 substrate-binding domain-containing protein [Ectothiorhodospira lacustris]MCG5510257.1 substrate-binding domain-containing protein [Ectothiorhodospira lacustris]MCG5521876.1 substrate-binding domain-containing protein [Ectothiorhodospira lacustris]
MQYWDIGSYLGRYPDQQSLLHDFTARVRSAPRPLPADMSDRPVVRVALLYPDLQASDYWQRNLTAFERRARALGLNLSITVYSSQPGGIDPMLQAEQLRVALAGQPDYLVYTLDTPIHHRLAERLLAMSSADRAGPKIILQNITTPLRAWDGMQPFLYVGFDHIEGSRMLARHLAGMTSGQGEVVVLYAGDGYISEVRGDTFIREIAAFPGLRVRATYLTHLQMDVARRATEDALKRYPNAVLIYACATDIALGAVAAVANAGRGDTPLVNGWGGGAEELHLIGTGALAATIMRMNDDAGVAMAEAIAMDLQGEGHRVPQLFSGDMVLVTRDMEAATIDHLKQRAFRYSGAPADAPSRQILPAPLTGR